MSKIVSLNDILKEIEEKPKKPSSKRKIKSQDKYANNNNPAKTYADESKYAKPKKKKPSKLGFKKRSNYDRCKNSAIYSLAMREHSRLEITNKLKTKDYVEGVDLEKLLNELEESNYLNEARFVESFIRYRCGRGQGIIKISNDLRQRGIKASMISHAMLEADIDWFQLAKEQREKKFGVNKPEEYKEKTRQMRFLSGRGFDTDSIMQSVS